MKEVRDLELKWFKKKTSVIIFKSLKMNKRIIEERMMSNQRDNVIGNCHVRNEFKFYQNKTHANCVTEGCCVDGPHMQ